MGKKITLVGEAWGEKEEDAGEPFVGPSGYLLNNMLSQVGLDRRDCFVTNVFNLRPSRNDIKTLCGTKKEGIAGLPPIQRGKYLLPQYQSELDRLYSEVRNENSNLIVALGATAAWAFLYSLGIKTIRGAVAQTSATVSQTLGREYKVLPTIHPAAVMRDWSQRPIVLADLEKAKRESEFPNAKRPSRKIWIEPSLEDLARYEKDYIVSCSLLSADIETAKDQITCIGFAPSDDTAIVVPIFTDRKASKNYWPTLEHELEAWRYIRRWLAMKPTVFQNGMYDVQFLWRSYGIPVPLFQEDTMLMHHAMQPEMEKGLGFLATIYTDECSWKQMRKGTRHD